MMVASRKQTRIPCRGWWSHLREMKGHQACPAEWKNTRGWEELPNWIFSFLFQKMVHHAIWISQQFQGYKTHPPKTLSHGWTKMKRFQVKSRKRRKMRSIKRKKEKGKLWKCRVDSQRWSWRAELREWHNERRSFWQPRDLLVDNGHAIAITLMAHCSACQMKKQKRAAKITFETSFSRSTKRRGEKKNWFALMHLHASLVPAHRFNTAKHVEIIKRRGGDRCGADFIAHIARNL